MSDIRQLLETLDSMAAAEKKPQGPKFPGYWTGGMSADNAKDKMVGCSEQQDSIIKELEQEAKNKNSIWKLKEKYKAFSESEYEANNNNTTPNNKTKPKTWDQLTSAEKLSGVKGRTVWNPKTQKYRTVFDVPVTKEINEYGNATDPNQQTSNPNQQTSSANTAQKVAQDKQNLATTTQNASVLRQLDPKINPQLSTAALTKTTQPGAQMSGAEIGQSKELVKLLQPALANKQIAPQLTALLRRAGKVNQSGLQ